MKERLKQLKMSRLQILTSKFESFKMIEDETITDYNMRGLDIINESFALGEKISWFRRCCRPYHNVLT